MCLMIDQFLWGHSSRDSDISCLSEPSSTFKHLVRYMFMSGKDSGETVMGWLTEPLLLTTTINTKILFNPLFTGNP